MSLASACWSRTRTADTVDRLWARHAQSRPRRVRGLRQGVKDIEFIADPSAGEVRIGCPGR